MSEVLKIKDQSHYNALVEAVESETITPVVQTFSTEVHKLLLDSVGRIADDWIGQLNILRENTNVLEAQIIAYVGKTKSDISALHELGAKVTEEARRGSEICQQLRAGLEKIAE